MKQQLLMAAIIASASALATPKIIDRSVIGRWTFDDASDFGKDTSGYDASSFVFSSGLTGVAAGGIANTGYLNISTKGASVQATLGQGSSVSLSTPQTIAVWFKSDCDSITSGGDAGAKAVIGAFNDHSNWHFATMRYQKGLTASSYGWMLATDPSANSFWNDNSRAETASDNKPYLPFSVSGSTVTLGGDLGMRYNSRDYKVAYKGLLDEVVILNRMMTKEELTRLYQTGETYIFTAADIGVPIEGDNRKQLFSGYYLWTTRTEYTSSNPADKAPGAFPGAAYMIDRGSTMLTQESGVFGGDVSKKVSLTLGRVADLKNRITGETVVPKSTGNLTQAGGEGSGLTFYDLRLNNGQIVVVGSDNQHLTTTLLDLGSTDLDQPFMMYVNYNGTYVFDAGGAVTGSGVLEVHGNDGTTVVVQNFTPDVGSDTPRLRLASGSIKTKYLNGFKGGTLLVDTKGAVDFRGNDRYAAWPLHVRCIETLSAGKYPILTVPNIHTSFKSKDDIILTQPTLANDKLVCEVVVEQTDASTRTVYLDCKIPPAEIPVEDKGPSPILVIE